MTKFPKYAAFYTKKEPPEIAGVPFLHHLFRRFFV